MQIAAFAPSTAQAAVAPLTPGSAIGSFNVMYPATVDTPSSSHDVRVDAVELLGNTEGYAGINAALNAVQQLGTDTYAIVGADGDRFADTFFLYRTQAVTAKPGEPVRVDPDALRFAMADYDATVTPRGPVEEAILVDDTVAWDPAGGAMTSLENLYEM